MGKHRAVEDRIAETQSQLNALLAKAAKEEVNENVEIVKIDAEIKKITTDTLKFNRWASEGEDKIANFKARVATWESRLATATKKVDEANAKLKTLRAQRKGLAETLASEMTAGE